MKAVISLSGGLNSTCLLMHLLTNVYADIRAFSFNYGQKHDIELKKVQKNIKFLQKKGFNRSANIKLKISRDPQFRYYHSVGYYN